MTPARPANDTGVGARSGLAPDMEEALPTEGRRPDFRRAPKRAKGLGVEVSGFARPAPACGGGDRKSAEGGGGWVGGTVWGVVEPRDNKAASAPLPSRPSMDTGAGGAATGAAPGGETVGGG